MPGRRPFRSVWRPFLSRLHAWAGLFLCLWLVMLGTTGTLLAFRDDWVRLTVPASAGGLPEATAEGLAVRARAAEAALPGEVRLVRFATDRLPLDQVFLTDKGGALLDPRTGALLDRWAENGRVMEWLFDLHHRLLLGDVGLKAIGFAGLALVVMLLAGVVLASATWGRFKGRVWPKNPRRAALITAHRDLGLLLALPLLLAALTGVALSFPESSRALAAWVSGPMPVVPPPPKPDPAAAPDLIAWEAVFAAAGQRFPDATIRFAIWPTPKNAAVELRLRQPAEWHPNGRTTLRVDVSGAMLAGQDATALPAGFQILNTAYPLHSGRVGGLAYRLAVALAGVGLVLLSGYGTLAYLRRLRGGKAAGTVP